MSNARSFLIIVNPISGRGRALRVAEAVGAELRAVGAPVTIEQTSRSGHAQQIARDYASEQTRRPTCIAGCGGDGTMQEIANALAGLRTSLGETCPLMGVLPAGRCNDLARALKLPRRPSAMAQVLANGTPCAIDLGRVNDRYFCTVATAGVDAEISSFVDTMRVPLRGTPAYLYGALRVLPHYKPKKVRISGAFGVVEKHVFLASSANTASYGGAIPIAPNAVPTDGQLDLCVIDSLSMLRALSVIPAVLRGKHQHRPEVQFLRTDRLTIESEQPMELWADGERVGTTPATIEAVPGAVRILLPSGSAIEE